MSDKSQEEKLAELQQTGEAIGKLAADEAAFTRAAEAFRAQNAENFQSELGKLGLQPFCRLICRWFCSKHCVFICFKLCREAGKSQDQPSIAEWGVCAGHSAPGQRRGTAQAVPGRGRARGCSGLGQTAGRVQVAALLSSTLSLFVLRPLQTCVSAVVPAASPNHRGVPYSHLAVHPRGSWNWLGLRPQFPSRADPNR